MAVLAATFVLLIYLAFAAAQGTIPAKTMMGAIFRYGLAPDMAEPIYSTQIETLTLAEARVEAPIAFGLPVWVPSAYIRQDGVQMISASERPPVTTIWVRWMSPEGTIAFQLEVEQRLDGSSPRVVTDSESAEAVTVNEGPAALVRGAWYADTGVYEWTGGLSLFWTQDGLRYALRSWDQEITADDLVRMAESVQVP